MTSQSPRIYLYKITFEEVPYYYYGVHKEKKYNEEYWGSPKTNKWCWDFYTPKKQILEFFDFSDEGWIEAQEVENRLIKPFFNTDKWCLNECCGGIISLQVNRETGKKVTQKNKEQNIGVFAFTEIQRSEYGKKGGKKSRELCVGIHAQTTEQRSEAGKIGGNKAYEMRVGVHARSKEQMIEHGRKGTKTQRKNKIGIYGMTYEQRSNLGKENIIKTNSQRWMCLETGYITNSGALSRYQKARGIDTTKRVRVS